jgi:hypothetical protein
MQMDRHCLLNGCQLGRASEMAAEAKRMLDQAISEKREAMSGALWCDLGGHAFSSRDKKRATYKVQTFDDDGNPAEDELTACGPHAAERQATLKPRAAIPQGADPEEYTRYLEWKAGLPNGPVVPGMVEP